MLREEGNSVKKRSKVAYYSELKGISVNAHSSTNSTQGDFGKLKNQDYSSITFEQMIPSQFWGLPKTSPSRKQVNNGDKEKSPQQHQSKKQGQQPAKKKEKTEHGLLLFKLNPNKTSVQAPSAEAETEVDVQYEMDVDQEIDEEVDSGLLSKKKNKKQKHGYYKERFSASEESITSHIWNESVHEAHIQSKLQPSKVKKRAATEAKGEHGL